MMKKSRESQICLSFRLSIEQPLHLQLFTALGSENSAQPLCQKLAVQVGGHSCIARAY